MAVYVGNRSAPRAVWLVRLAFGLLLLWGSEVLLWTNPPGRALLEWPLLAAGYVLLAALLLDLAARYRVGDLFGALLLGGVYSLGASLAVNPASMYSDLPLTLLTRVLGAHALMGVEMFGLLLALTGGGQGGRWLLIGAAIIGVSWGVWARWFPVLNEPGYGAVELPAAVAWAAAGLAAALAALWAVGRRGTALAVDDLRLSRSGWGAALLGLLALAAVRLLRGETPPAALLPALPLLALVGVILWFRGRRAGRALLDARIPPRLPPVLTLAAALALFFALAAAGYHLPLLEIGPFNLLTLIGVAFTAYGVTWLPTVSLVLGVRAYLRQAQRAREV